MANAGANKLYRTFVKGLVTEASPLTYPEDSSFDELNTVPSRKGNRIRRFGINYSSGNTTARTYDKTTAKSEFMWRAVAAQPTLSFLVVQNGSALSFYDRTVAAFASSLKNFSIDLNLYTRPGVTDVSKMCVRMAAGKGFLFIVGPDIEPLIVSYNPTVDTITATKIIILARDFDGLPDGLQNDEEPNQLSSQHFYNLLNQGWIKP